MGIGQAINDAEAAVAVFRKHMQDKGTWRQEQFMVIALDARGRVNAVETVALGTLTACLVHPREVFWQAIKHAAASIIVGHNHPSGDATPSDEDGLLTDRLQMAGEILGIPLTDHVVFTENGLFHSIDAIAPTTNHGSMVLNGRKAQGNG